MGGLDDLFASAALGPFAQGEGCLGHWLAVPSLSDSVRLQDAYISHPQRSDWTVR